MKADKVLILIQIMPMISFFIGSDRDRDSYDTSVIARLN